MKIIKNMLFAVTTVFRFIPRISILTAILSLVAGLCPMLQVMFTERLVDGVQFGSSSVFLYGGLLVLVLLLSKSEGFTYQLLGSRRTMILERELIPEIMDKLMRIEYAVLEGTEAHDAMERLSQRQPAYSLSMAYGFIVQCFTMLVGLLSLALVFFTADKWLGTGALVLAVPMFAIRFKSVYQQQKAWRQTTISQRKSDYLGKLFSDKNALYEFKLFDSSEYMLEQWDESMGDVFKEYKASMKKIIALNFIGNLLTIAYAVYTVMTLLSGVLDGSVSVGTMIALIGSLPSLFRIIDRSANCLSEMLSRIMDIDYYRELMIMQETENLDGTVSGAADIVFDNVSFTYPGTNKPVLSNVSFTIPDGCRVAFVGENGAGKSTIVKLLCGFYMPDSGKITIGGMDNTRISEEERRKLFSVVFQDFQSYQLTLRENVAFGNISDINNDEKLKKALKLSGAAELLDGMGLDASLGKIAEDGVDLSKGMWQRLATARTFMSESKFAILDEPAASLDPIAESGMYSSFAAMFKDRGTIMISHRMASAKMADIIYVLDGGRITEKGSHAELIDSGGLYSRMFKTQSIWYLC